MLLRQQEGVFSPSAAHFESPAQGTKKDPAAEGLFVVSLSFFGLRLSSACPALLIEPCLLSPARASPARRPAACSRTRTESQAPAGFPAGMPGEPWRQALNLVTSSASSCRTYMEGSLNSLDACAISSISSFLLTTRTRTGFSMDSTCLLVKPKRGARLTRFCLYLAAFSG